MTEKADNKKAVKSYDPDARCTSVDTPVNCCFELFSLLFNQFASADFPQWFAERQHVIHGNAPSR